MAFVLDAHHQFREIGTEFIDGHPLCFVGLLDRGRSFDLFPKIQVHIMFKPYGAFKLFGIPQHHLCNQGTNLELMFSGIGTLIEQLRSVSQSPEQVIALLENWLLKRLEVGAKTDVKRMVYACHEIQKNQGMLKIDALCKQMGMSATTMGDQFREKVGFSPKAYSRIVRFNQINNYISKHPMINWQELVYMFGFFDQNHFIKEFKQFYGCTPSQWHNQIFKIR